MRRFLFLLVAVTTGASAMAAPTLSGVLAGSATVTQPASATTLITQGTDKAILAWRDFSIRRGETVQFQQPGSSSVALNRVTGTDPSTIFGSLQANGKVFLVNPNGILFGAGARVDVGSLVASTLEIGNDDFLAGRAQFQGTSRTGVHVAGPSQQDPGAVLTAAERGTIALLGATVSNHGTLTARLGTVGLAAGGSVTLDFQGDGLTQLAVTPAQLDALVTNGGAITADGGQVVMTASSLAALAGLVVQHGAMQANALVERNGRLVLDAGTVRLAGQLEASSGTVLVNARATLDMARDAVIRTDAPDTGDGGLVLLHSLGAVRLHGAIGANGGPGGGNGGVIATTGATVDAADLRASAAAPRGNAGVWSLTANAVAIDAPLAASIARALDTDTGVAVNARSAPQAGAADITVTAPVVKTSAGHATLALNADENIVLADRILAAGGMLDVDLNAGAHGMPGAIALAPGAAIASHGGQIALFGNSDPMNGFASASASHADGIVLDGASLDGGGGAVTLRGAGSRGSISATPPDGAGVAVIHGSSVRGATVAVTGVAATGVVLRDAAVRATDALTLLGRGAKGGGVVLANVDMATAAGTVDIAGESAGSAPGLAVDGLRIGAAGMQGNVSLRALNDGTAASLVNTTGANAVASLATTGVIDFRPGGVDAAGHATEAPGVEILVGGAGAAAPFQVTPSHFGIAPGARVVIGSSAQRGTITYADPAPFDGDLTLQGNGIVLAAPLATTGLLTLSASGLVAGAGQPVTAAGLLLHGSGPAASFQLTHPGNRIGTLAAQFDTQFDQQDGQASSVHVVDSTALTLAPLRGAGYDAGQGATSIVAASSVAPGDIVIESAQQLTLAQDVASLHGAITLVAGTVFDNTARATLGGPWRVYADTWVNEVRGGLAPAANVYHCAAGSACGAALGGNGASGYFIYRQQPTLRVTADPAALSRVYGDANPAPGWTVSGLVNGDRAADVLAGGYVITAGMAAGVGTYAVQGAFTSPAGYAIDARPGVLRVDPAPLLVRIDDQTGVLGGATPQLTAVLTGLKGQDTAAVITGLQLAAPTGAAATVGRHAITGSGAIAANYTIAYQDGVLTIVPGATQSGAGVLAPSILRNLTFVRSDLYDQNLGAARVCNGANAFAAAGSSGDSADMLGVEWSRVRVSPNLTNCFDLGQRNGCQDF